MTRRVLSPELKRVRKRLFVCAHECGKLLLRQVGQVLASTAGATESHRMRAGYIPL